MHETRKQSPAIAGLAGWRAWMYYLHFYRGSFLLLFGGVAASVIQCLLLLPIPLLIRHAFETQVPSGNVAGLVLTGAVLLALNLLNSLVSLWVRHATLRATKSAIRRLRGELVDLCYGLSRAFHDRTDRAKLHASIVQDTERLDGMSSALAGMFLPSLVVCAGLTAVLVWLSPLLFATMSVVAPPMLLAGQLMKRKMLRHIQTSHRSFENFSKGVLFVLERLDLTRMQCAEDFECARQREHIDDLSRTSSAMDWATTAHTTVQKSISVVSGVLILIVGGIAVTRGGMSVPELISFYFAGVLLNHHLAVMITALPQMYAGGESLRTLFQLARVADTPPYSGSGTVAFRGHISLEDVHFAYAEQPVLRGVSLSLTPGRIVALVGPNGAGKTTIIHLIAGSYRPQQGRLRAEGAAYDELDIKRLRAGMAIVSQDPVIFPGTIRDNILYGRPDASMEEIVEASRLATAHSFIEKLPEGYETQTGDDGMLLSGGQRQRIAIARALMRRPQLLILDEPTTHLDHAANEQLLAMLRRLDHQPAIFCITHDAVLAAEADDIARLDDLGHLVAGEDPQPAPVVHDVPAEQAT